MKQVLRQASLRIDRRTVLNWWTGADVDYRGTGWGHGPRRLLAQQFALPDTAANLFQLGVHSQLQSGRVRITGHLLELIITDSAMVGYQNELIRRIHKDPRYGTSAFRVNNIPPKVLGFGGKRTGGDNWNKLSRQNPVLHKSTWQVAAN
jgi:hypothetical protein